MTVKRKCACPCGRSFETDSPRRRFFSSSCRSRVHRGAVAEVVDLPASASTRSKTPEEEARGRRGVAVAIERELEQAERLDTALGQACMVLARRIDASRDTGSAMATMTRELRATLAEATKGTAQEGSRVDELKRKRRERLERRRGA